MPHFPSFVGRLSPPRRRAAMSNPAQGFTLAELLAVVVILGILGAFTIPSVLSQIDQTKLATAKQSLRQLNQEQYKYLLQSGEFADTYKQLQYTPRADDYTFLPPRIGEDVVISVAQYEGGRRLPDLRAVVRVTPRGELRTRVAPIK